MNAETDSELKIMQANVKTLKLLKDQDVIMLALAEILMVLDIPIGALAPLHSELRRRSGIRSDMTEEVLGTTDE